MPTPTWRGLALRTSSRGCTQICKQPQSPDQFRRLLRLLMNPRTASGSPQPPAVPSGGRFRFSGLPSAWLLAKPRSAGRRRAACRAVSSWLARTTLPSRKTRRTSPPPDARTPHAWRRTPGFGRGGVVHQGTRGRRSERLAGQQGAQVALRQSLRTFGIGIMASTSREDQPGHGRRCAQRGHCGQHGAPRHAVIEVRPVAMSCAVLTASGQACPEMGRCLVLHRGFHFLRWPRATRYVLTACRQQSNIE